MNKQAIEVSISEQLSLRKKRILNRNAIGDLFGAFSVSDWRSLSQMF